MFLQTLVQLNILILATPALAGWIALPMAQPGMVQAACVVLQSRAAEAGAPKQSLSEVACRTQAARRLPAILPRFTVAFQHPADQHPIFPAPMAIASFHPFPHAIRAP